jgi:hypothetical protein
MRRMSDTRAEFFHLGNFFGRDLSRMIQTVPGQVVLDSVEVPGIEPAGHGWEDGPGHQSPHPHTNQYDGARRIALRRRALAEPDATRSTPRYPVGSVLLILAEVEGRSATGRTPDSEAA